MDIIKLTDGAITFGYMVKGFVDDDLLVGAAEIRNGHPIDNYRIERATVRYIPDKNISGLSHRIEYSKPGRGAFPATFLWFE